MKRALSIIAIVSWALILSAPAHAQGRSDGENLSRADRNAPPMLGLHWERGFNPSYLQRPSRPGHGSSPDMTWHGGDILVSTDATSIFWGTSWDPSQTDEIDGIDRWYAGFSGSSYAATSDEYSGANGRVGPTLTYRGHIIDNSRAAAGNNTSNILAEVCKVIASPKPNGYYAVYVDLPRKGSYCAYHSWGTCAGTRVQFAFFWKLDGDAGCDPASTVSSNSQGLNALANVSAHELSETRTDPAGDGWYDAGGAENGDKCNWTFHDQPVQFPDGSWWKLQGEWSNSAYDSRTGYANGSGQDGCLDGDGDDPP